MLARRLFSFSFSRWPGLLAVTVAVFTMSLLGDFERAFAKETTKFVYFGTYTGSGSEGIYVSTWDAATGKLGEPQLAAKSASPSFLAIHPQKTHLYAVCESGTTQSVRAFTINAETGLLTPVNDQSSKGEAACHLAIDRNASAVVVANYTSGSVSLLPLDGKGKLLPAKVTITHKGQSVNPNRQKGPHAHCTKFDLSGKRVLVADLGTDDVFIYDFDGAKQTLIPSKPKSLKLAPGSGPRHVAFSPDGKHLYVINELLSTVTQFEVGTDGRFAECQTLSTLPAEFKGENTTAEVVVHPSGRFVYGSNRGHDSIAAFKADPASGELTALGQTPTGGKVPRNFNIDPTGHFLLAANQDSDDVFVFGIDQETGKLNPTGQKVVVHKPVCVVFYQAE